MDKEIGYVIEEDTIELIVPKSGFAIDEKEIKVIKHIYV